MSALLQYLKIHDKKSYHQWALENHPDKRQGDPEATRKFQEVQAEWEKHRARLKRKFETHYPHHHDHVPKKPKTNEFDDFMATMRKTAGTRCNQSVKGCPGGMCMRSRHKNTNYCFWHQPGTDHMKFVDEPERDFFGKLFDIHGDRTEETCEARCANGKFCHGKKTKGRNICGIHIRAEKRRDLLKQ